MKTLRKIGIVTLATSLALASALASPVAEQIATFGYYGKWVLGVLIGYEVIKAIAAHSPASKATVAIAGGKMGDWIKKRAKKFGTSEVRAVGEAAAEYKWLTTLRTKVAGATGKKAELDDIKSSLNKEEREERTFQRRLEKVMDEADTFKKRLSDPTVTSQIDRSLSALRPLSARLIFNMARGGKFEFALGKKDFKKGAIDKKYSTDLITWKKHQAEMIDILDESISADQAIVKEVQNLEALTKRILSS
ncbi:MAG: hypothetical protein WCV90_05150 [Candidatus Woesearchaeota archaeon]|jgi:hypothetical protein